MRTIAEMLRWRARRHPSLEAVWFDGQSHTFAEFNESTSQLAAGFVEKLKLAPGDRVGILDKNCAAYFELLFALDKAGLVAAPLNWRLTPREVKQIVDDAKPKLIVTGAEFKATGEATGVPTMTFADLPRGGGDPRRDRDGAVCAQFCTSGTTGLPKGAMLTGWNLLNVGFCGAIEAPEMREGGRSMVCLPLFHIGGTIWATWAMQTGSTVVVVREPLPDVLLKAMVEQRIESTLLVPTLMLLMSELPAARTADFSALKLITYGRRQSRRICCAARSRRSNAASRNCTGSRKRPGRSRRSRTKSMPANVCSLAAGRCSAAACASSIPRAMICRLIRSAKSSIRAKTSWSAIGRGRMRRRTRSATAGFTPATPATWTKKVSSS